MKQRQWQLALRELVAGMHQSKRVLALVSVAAILGVSGPFGTHDQMQILPWLLYWGVLSSVTFWPNNFYSVLRSSNPPRPTNYAVCDGNAF